VFGYYIYRHQDDKKCSQAPELLSSLFRFFLPTEALAIPSALPAGCNTTAGLQVVSIFEKVVITAFNL
jgi:hypothetical protein